MIKWYEILEIAKSIQFTQEPDALIWKFTSNGQFDVKTMYAFINFRGVKLLMCMPFGKLKFLQRFNSFFG
jgi:hypothetical protein